MQLIPYCKCSEGIQKGLPRNKSKMKYIIKWKSPVIAFVHLYEWAAVQEINRYGCDTLLNAANMFCQYQMGPPDSPGALSGHLPGLNPPLVIGE